MGKRGPKPKQDRPLIEPWEQRVLDAWVKTNSIEATAAVTGLAASTVRQYLSKISSKLNEAGVTTRWGRDAVREWVLQVKPPADDDAL
jgi:DNA-binding NarL/FixJ family response regulator